ncbi:MAG: alanine racemase [Bacteroidales bacterium]|nr:alanine racemase [Bacteroidales bacterium]
MSTSVIELSKTALHKNISFLKQQLNTTRISSVVKANAYGHGAKEFIMMAQGCGVDHFSVFSSEEARKVKSYLNNGADIMIMGWVNDNDIQWIIENEIEVLVFDFDRLQKLLDVAKRIDCKVKLHIDLETGMNRTGFEQKDIDKLFKILKRNKKHYEFEGLCTHFAGAESIANYKRIKDQIGAFDCLYQCFIKSELKPKIRHVACSAAALSYPETQFDMVRIGILQYGFWPSKETLIYFLSKKQIQDSPLQEILSWKSKVMSIKNVAKGEFVSYGTSYLAQKDMKIAIVPVGYSQGYARNLSNQGRVLIKGHRVGVIGMVNMNMLIADVTTVKSVKIGDEVVLIGKQGDLSIPVASFSEFSDQLNYELLTRLPAEIPRVIIK